MVIIRSSLTTDLFTALAAEKHLKISKTELLPNDFLKRHWPRVAGFKENIPSVTDTSPDPGQLLRLDCMKVHSRLPSCAISQLASL
jgi:hypothetical protein